jgi:anti-sigma factor (TIGR02949 family)
MAIASTKFNEPSRDNSKKNICSDIAKTNLLFSEVVDGEASVEDQIFFDNHIKKCVICAENYKLELSLKEALKTKIEYKKVPAEFIENIKLQIRQTDDDAQR